MDKTSGTFFTEKYTWWSQASGNTVVSLLCLGISKQLQASAEDVKQEEETLYSPKDEKDNTEHASI